MVILLVAILTNALTSKLIYSKELADKRKEQAQTLYRINSSLTKPGGIIDVAAVSVKCLADLFGRTVIFIVINNRDNTLQEIAHSVSRYVTTIRY